MKRVRTTALMLLVFTCITMSHAHAEMTAARVLLGRRELVLSPAAVYDGKRVLAPLGMLEALGATHVVSTDGKTAKVTAAGGESGDVAVAMVKGERMLAVDEVVRLAGGESIWDAQSRALTLRASLHSVEFIDNKLRINCSWPVTCSVKEWKSSGKLIVDVADAKMTSEAKEVYVGGPNVARARLGQYDDDTARVVLDLVKSVDYRMESNTPASQIALVIGDDLPEPSAPAPRVVVKPAKVGPCRIEGIRVQALDENRCEVVISTTGRASVTPSFGVNPPEVALNFDGASMSDLMGEPEGSHPLIKSIKVRSKSGGAHVTLSLARVAVYDVNVSEDSVTVAVRPPDRSGGTLAGKLIVIDPGHGGRDGGARCCGVCEKDINLKIVNELSAALQAVGARTVLTRTSDQLLGLSARPEVCIANDGDIFVSIHCNSNGAVNSVSGIETYYHMQEPSAKALAYSIHDGVCSATGMCDRKPRSDRSLYASGLKVLRCLENSGRPGVLLECGYLNHSSDRAKLVDEGYRKKLAAGIVAGLKAYVEGK